MRHRIALLVLAVVLLASASPAMAVAGHRAHVRHLTRGWAMHLIRVFDSEHYPAYLNVPANTIRVRACERRPAHPGNVRLSCVLHVSEPNCYGRYEWRDAVVRLASGRMIVIEGRKRALRPC